MLKHTQRQSRGGRSTSERDRKYMYTAFSSPKETARVRVYAVSYQNSIIVTKKESQSNLAKAASNASSLLILST